MDHLINPFHSKDIHTSKEIDILLVEDNPGDVRLTQEVIKDSKLRNSLRVITDGREAMKFLKKEGVYADSAMPDIILLDLNLPFKNGKEILAEIKQDPALKDIPVAVLTHSEVEADILKAQELNASCYLVKPVDIEQFIMVVRSIDTFYLSIVKVSDALI